MGKARSGDVSNRAHSSPFTDLQDVSKEHAEQITMTQLMRRLTLDSVWIGAVVVFIALRALLTPAPPHDLWWHMATGRLITTTGAIPTVDSFSYTQAGEVFYNQSWLAQLLMYGLYQLGGLELMTVFQAVLLAGTYGLLLWFCIRRTGAIRLSAAIILGMTMPASFDNWTIRPQTYALPLFVIYLIVLTEWRAGRRASLWLLPVLAAIWVNLHGSFVLGGALVALAFIGEMMSRLIGNWREANAWAQRPIGVAEDVLTRPDPPKLPPLRELFITGVLVGTAWLLNPGGFQVIGYVRNLIGSSPVTQIVTEWSPMTIRDPNGVIFFLFVTIGVAILAYAKRTPNLTEMLWTGAFFWLALSAVRNNIWFTAVATPLFIVQAASMLPKARLARFQGTPVLNGAILALLSLCLLICLPWIKPALGLPPELGALTSSDTPIAGVEALRSDPARPERLFHDLPYGSYLIWAAPEQLVWIDPRIELYPLEQWRHYQALSTGQRTEELLTQYAIDGLLLSTTQQSGLVEYVREHPEQWPIRYEDADTVYAVKR